MPTWLPLIQACHVPSGSSVIRHSLPRIQNEPVVRLLGRDHVLDEPADRGA